MKRFKVYLEVTTIYSMIVDTNEKNKAGEIAEDSFDEDLCDFEGGRKIEVTDVQRIESE